MAKYVTRIERFEAGDFPMVCVRSGRPATKMVPVQAMRNSVWPWFFLFSVLDFVAASLLSRTNNPWGLLPFADGEVHSIRAEYERGIGVILTGVHQDFIDATREQQRGR